MQLPAWLAMIDLVAQEAKTFEASAEVHEWSLGDGRKATLVIGKRRPEEQPQKWKGVGAGKQVQISFGCPDMALYFVPAFCFVDFVYWLCPVPP